MTGHLTVVKGSRGAQAQRGSYRGANRGHRRGDRPSMLLIGRNQGDRTPPVVETVVDLSQRQEISLGFYGTVFHSVVPHVLVEFHFVVGLELPAGQANVETLVYLFESCVHCEFDYEILVFC